MRSALHAVAWIACGLGLSGLSPPKLLLAAGRPFLARLEAHSVVGPAIQSIARDIASLTQSVSTAATLQGRLAASWWLLISVALPALTQFRGGPWVWLSKNVVFGIRVIDHPGKEPRRQRGQRPSAYPPPYPNGWFRIGGSWQLAIKGVQPLRVLGHDLVLYRTESGVARVMDAYCPHRGGHLGMVGVVEGENIHCTNHGWQFGPQGHCVHIPGRKPESLPAVAARTWHVTEAWDSIFLWHHSEALPPQWDVLRLDGFRTAAAPAAQRSTPSAPGMETPFLYFAGHTSASVGHTHIQEIPENCTDIARWDVVRFLPKWSWHNETPSSTNRKTAAILLPSQQGLCNRVAFVVAQSHQICPGIVRHRITVLDRFTIIVHEYVTPTGPTTQRAVHTVHATHGTPRFLAQSALSMLDAQLREHREHPEREPSVRCQVPDRWNGDFYGPSSVPFPEAVAKESMLEPW